MLGDQCDMRNWLRVSQAGSCMYQYQDELTFLSSNLRYTPNFVHHSVFLQILPQTLILSLTIIVIQGQSLTEAVGWQSTSNFMTCLALGNQSCFLECL